MAIRQYQVCPECGSDYEPPFICDVCYNKLYEDTAKRVEKLRADKEAEKRDLKKKAKKVAKKSVAGKIS
jgi:hypothetical protein